MTDQKVLICARVDEAETVIRGSVPGICADCRGDVWISPDGDKFLHENFVVHVQCTTCFEGFLDTTSDADFLDLHLASVPGAENTVGAHTVRVGMAYMERRMQRERRRRR